MTDFSTTIEPSIGSLEVWGTTLLADSEMPIKVLSHSVRLLEHITRLLITQERHLNPILHIVPPEDILTPGDQLHRAYLYRTSYKKRQKSDFVARDKIERLENYSNPFAISPLPG